MRLSEVEKGQRLLVISVENEKMRPQAMRLGIIEGAKIVCVGKIRGGPIIISGNGFDTAVGKRIAEKILVTAERGITNENIGFSRKSERGKIGVFSKTDRNLC